MNKCLYIILIIMMIKILFFDKYCNIKGKCK